RWRCCTPSTPTCRPGSTATRRSSPCPPPLSPSCDLFGDLDALTENSTTGTLFADRLCCFDVGPGHGPEDVRETALAIDVLGALAVRENGVSITPTAPKPRQVLALLALNADRVVPVTDLIEELWGDSPPRSARTTLQTYVLQLR